MLLASLAQAEPSPAAADACDPSADGWQRRQAKRDEPAAQLSCFQRWADTQAQPVAPAAAPQQVAAPMRGLKPASPSEQWRPLPLPSLNSEAQDSRPAGCKDSQYSELSKFWELQRGTDCGTFSLRGYRPITLAVVGSNSVNQQPDSPAAGHTAFPPAQPYQRFETKFQLSVRTKIAAGLLKDRAWHDADHDSLWFGYTQQSYWQLFNGNFLRPFRTTDHEPEVVFIYPHQIPWAAAGTTGCRAWAWRISRMGNRCRCRAAGTVST